MFSKFHERLQGVCRDVCGTTSIEYAFIVALIGLAAVGGFTQFANEMENLYNYIGTDFSAAQNN